VDILDSHLVDGDVPGIRLSLHVAHVFSFEKNVQGIHEVLNA
jgi:hypothetical protein